MEIDVKNVSERGGQPGRRQKKSLPPRTDDGRCIAMGGVVAPAGYKEPTGDSPPASECSDVVEAAEAEVERLNKTTRRWPSVVGRVMNAPRLRKRTGYRSVRTRPTVEALRSSLLPYYALLLRLSKRGQSRQAKCSCRGARPGCRGNTGGGRGREGSAVRYANPRGLHRQVRSRI